MKRNFLVTAIAIATVFALAGCGGEDNGTSDNRPNTAGSGVDFTNFTQPSIWIENPTDERLVAFKGSVAANNLISGIPARSGRHGLKHDTRLFNATQLYPLLLVKESDYAANKANLYAAPVFARLLAFYHHTATNRSVLEISPRLGGAGQLIINNPLPYNVVFHEARPMGAILGYAAGNMSQEKIYLKPGDYNIFPVFVLFNLSMGEIYHVLPKYTSGYLTGAPYMMNFSFNGTELGHTVDLGDLWVPEDSIFTTGSAYLRVINNSATAVALWNGGAILTTSTGFSYTNPSSSTVFSLFFPQNPDGTYPDSRNFSQLSIGMPAIEQLQIPAQDYELDYVYEIEVTGSNLSILQLGPVVKKEKVKLE